MPQCQNKSIYVGREDCARAVRDLRTVGFELVGYSATDRSVTAKMERQGKKRVVFTPSAVCSSQFTGAGSTHSCEFTAYFVNRQGAYPAPPIDELILVS